MIIKTAMGGGGKGMRVVRRMEDLLPFFKVASSEVCARQQWEAVVVWCRPVRGYQNSWLGRGKAKVLHDIAWLAWARVE